MGMTQRAHCIGPRSGAQPKCRGAGRRGPSWLQEEDSGPCEHLAKVLSVAPAVADGHLPAFWM